MKNLKQLNRDMWMIFGVCLVIGCVLALGTHWFVPSIPLWAFLATTWFTAMSLSGATYVAGCWKMPVTTSKVKQTYLSSVAYAVLPMSTVFWTTMATSAPRPGMPPLWVIYLGLLWLVLLIVGVSFVIHTRIAIAKDARKRMLARMEAARHDVLMDAAVSWMYMVNRPGVKFIVLLRHLANAEFFETLPDLQVRTMSLMRARAGWCINDQDTIVVVPSFVSTPDMYRQLIARNRAPNALTFVKPHPSIELVVSTLTKLKED